MAPLTFNTNKPLDLSGRTPIYRLTKAAPPIPKPTPPPVAVDRPGQQYQTPYHSPYQSPYPSSQSVPQDAKHVAPLQQNHNTEARSSPMTKRRGRKLQENEVLTLVNCCLEYQSMYSDNPSRFWYCVATSLKRQIKRNFSWQSCRQIVEELVAERRERRREVAAGKTKEQPVTDLVLATDKWITFHDTVAGSVDTTAPVESLKRPGQRDSPATDPNASKRPRQQDQIMHQTTPSTPGHPPLLPQPPQAVAAVAVPSVQSGATMSPSIRSRPTISEFQSLKADSQTLRMELQTLRREVQEFKQEIGSKLGLILQSLQEGKALDEAKEH